MGRRWDFANRYRKRMTPCGPVCYAGRVDGKKRVRVVTQFEILNLIGRSVGRQMHNEGMTPKGAISVTLRQDNGEFVADVFMDLMTPEERSEAMGEVMDEAPGDDTAAPSLAPE